MNEHAEPIPGYQLQQAHLTMFERQHAQQGHPAPLSCAWPGAHAGEAAQLVTVGRSCGHTETYQFPTCGGHLLMLQADPLALSPVPWCPSCNLYELAHIITTQNL